MVTTQGRFLDDDVVISGMSGRFPECDTIEEFHEKLLSGVDLIKENDSRWPKGYLNTYSRMGFIKDLRHFDASFFGMHPKLAERTDPIVRVLLETSVEAVIDAGICPTTLRGSETAVVVVVSSNEAADWWSADPDRVNGYEFLGCTRTMYSNRISFVLDLKGPSYTMDSQSSSGLLGIQQAYYMLKTGMVDAVIVAGVNLVLNPHFNIMFKKLNMLSPEGKCKVFDAEANGYARSEAGVAVLMQRARDAKRIYAIIAATESNCDGFKEFGCNTESLPSQISLYKEAIKKFNVNPLDVSFIEAHGYATLEGDETELAGIAKVYCKGRESPLLIGSVKSNMGHAEPAGGLVSLVKVLLAMEHGILPPNLHFKHPNPNIPALRDARLQVVDKVTVWDGEHAAINAFGIGGTNSHLVLKRYKKKKTVQQKSDIPRLMVVCGRTEGSVQSLLDKVKNLRNDNEFCALLYSVFSNSIPHFNYRAFAVYNEEKVTDEVATYIAQDTCRPVCFIFSGMGSQWSGMGKDLLQLGNFKSTIDSCAAVLKRVDFDLYALLNSTNEKIYDNVLNSFVGITCIQIGLVNILYELGIKPGFIIGHSIGELACAYADETLTLEQTVLITYWRGKSLIMTELPEGAMAAVGLSAAEVSEMLPDDITIACYNSGESVTVSGPRKSIDDFIGKLQSVGIFARGVNSSGYAFHSKYIAQAGSTFRENLEKIISKPKARTERWISTSVLESMWNTPKAQYSSAAYHLNNLLSPVFFDKALAHVPENTVVIEIAPHALLQSILKSSVSSTCSHFGLVRRNQSSVADLFSSIGRLYNAGLQPNVSIFYPPVEFPVSNKTPMLQSMIQWDHSLKWFLVSFVTKPPCLYGETETVVDVTEKKYEFLTDCVVDDIPTFPVSGFLYLIWEAVARFQVNFISEIPVVIENVQILRKCTVFRENTLKFTISILEESGDCEIKEDGVVVARAKVQLLQGEKNSFFDLPDTCGDYENYLPLKSGDVYLDLYEKGYHYKRAFQVIKYADNEGTCGSITWTDNWMAYIEGMLQMHLLYLNKQKYYSINHIQKIIIDPKKHIAYIDNHENADRGLSVSVHPNVNIIKSGGIEIRGIKSTLVSVRTKQPKPVIEQYLFVPNMSDKITSLDNALIVSVQLVCENQAPNTLLKTCEFIIDPCTHVHLSSKIEEIIAREPYVMVETVLSKHFSEVPPKLNKLAKYEDTKVDTYNFIFSSHILGKPDTLRKVLKSLTTDGFLLSVENAQNLSNEDYLDSINCKVITKFPTEAGICQLIRKTPIWKTVMTVNVKNDNFNWIDGIKMALRKHKIDGRNTMINFYGDDPTGIVGLLKCIRREPFGTGLRCLFTDRSIDPYKLVDLTYVNHFRKGLVINIYKNGEWGSYRHMPIREDRLVDCQHAFIGLTNIGDFASLSYIEGRIPYINLSNEIDKKLCHVYYVAVYPHQDIFHALGQLAYDEKMDQTKQVGKKFKLKKRTPKKCLQEYPNHEICHVYYSSIYAHDFRSALGHLPYDDHYNVTKQGSVLGHEYSGRDSNGRRVCGMVGGGALATTVLADRTVMWNVPDKWTLEEASTIPRVYSVAYYGLIMRGQLQKGEIVYINSGISGLCVACLNVAISIGAIPFIGFNNTTEKEYLLETFPELPRTNFIDLERYSFEYQLLNITNGKGVHLIFDTLNSHKRHAFVDCLSFSGRLVEFEKNSAFNESLGYTAIKKNITFHKISHSTLWVSEAGREDRIRIQKLVEEGIRAGVIKPIRTNIFTDQQVEEAFRTAQSGKFIGKVVIKFRDEEELRNVIPKTKIVKAHPSAFLIPENSYIVTSGLSEHGIQIVDWLIIKGANKIVLHSSYKPVTGYQSLALRRWKAANVHIILSNADIASLNGAESLIRTATSIGIVGGIFHVGYVACECTFDTATKSHFELLWKMKVDAAKCLDIASRDLCAALKYFVGFSDTDSLFGREKKSMLGYSCAAMEMVYEQRKVDGYPAIAIQVGQLDKFEMNCQSRCSHGRFPFLKFSSVLKELPYLLNQCEAIISVYVKGISKAENSIESVDKIANILGLKSIDKFYYTTFEKIGLEPVALAAIEMYLRENNIDFTKQEIQKLSINKIFALFKSKTKFV